MVIKGESQQPFTVELKNVQFIFQVRPYCLFSKGVFVYDGVGEVSCQFEEVFEPPRKPPMFGKVSNFWKSSISIQDPHKKLCRISPTLCMEGGLDFVLPPRVQC